MLTNLLHLYVLNWGSRLFAPDHLINRPVESVTGRR